MFLAAWLILGLVSGLLVHKLVFPTKPGLIADGVIGLFGALIGGFVFNVLGPRYASEVNPWSMAVALVGALLMLGGFHLLQNVGHGADLEKPAG